MDSVRKILDRIEIPRMYKVKNNIESPCIEDIPGTVRRILNKPEIRSTIQPGQTVAVTVGSRGILNKPLIIKTLIEVLKEWGADPFMFPAMGSHGGAVAEGQREMLINLGFTEEYIGAPIKSSMETVQVAETKTGLPVFIDKYAYEADAVIISNRVKVHTAFSGEIESGLVKMGVIGLGKQKGADICHELGFEVMESRLKEIFTATVENLNIPFGLALIENGQHQTAEIHAVPGKEILEKEVELQKTAKRLLARVPFKELEVLVIDRIGKNISGTGLDPNVVGRYHTGLGSGGPSIRRIAVLDITDVSHGNGAGLGISDFTTQRAYKKFDFGQTYPNLLTSNVPVAGMIPVVMPNDKMAFQAAIKTCLLWNKSEARVVRIKDTLSLEEFEVSETLLTEVKANPKMTVIEGPYELEFDAEGNFQQG